jgi:hypothetical protein
LHVLAAFTRASVSCSVAWRAFMATHLPYAFFPLLFVTRLLQRPHNRRRILGQLNRGERRHDLARQVRAAPAAAQLLGARRSASRAGRPALGRHVTRDQPSGGARCVPASEPSRLLSRPVHSPRRQAERATVPGDAFESSPSYVLGPELRQWIDLRRHTRG